MAESSEDPCEEAERSSDYEQDEDTDSSGYEPRSKRSKRTKFSGAYQYKTKFNKEWQKDWPFVL